MCGIIGYIGDKKCTPILINGLLKLEYRGYDSVGIATIYNGSLKIVKNKGRVKNLVDDTIFKDTNSLMGIAHTSWATHGRPSRENAHPHTDNSKTFAVVHNGIIENYLTLKNFLEKNGYTFYSQTDTEVIPNLIHYYYNHDLINDTDKFLRAVNNACKDLIGSYSIEVICTLYPNIIIVVRKDSPLIIGTKENEQFIASDIPAILDYTNKFYFLSDSEIAVIQKNEITFYDMDLNSHSKGLETIDLNSSSIDKNGYEDYMLKEIYEQPLAIRNTISNRIFLDRICNFPELSFSKAYLSTINNIYIVACGTAMHSGLTGKVAFETLCNIPVIVDIASEFRYRNPIIDKHSLCIFISQSGETADTIAALKLAKQKGAKTLAIVNTLNSSITREADYFVYTYAGPEIAVASTKAYTSQVSLLISLAIYFAEILDCIDNDYLQNLKNEIIDLPNKLESTLYDISKIKNLAHTLINATDVFFLGRGIDYNTSLEGALKLKEISYIHAEAYPAGELKHGPIALISNNTPVICIITDEGLATKTISNLEEVESRGANTIVVSDKNINHKNLLLIPRTSKILSPILSIVPLQLLSYYISKEKGLDVDKPRNLAKSVTVE